MNKFRIMNLLRDTNHSVEQLVLLRFIVVKSVKRRSKSMKLPSFVINIKLESLYELFVQSLHSFLIQSPTETQFTIDSSFLMSFHSLKNSTAPTNNCVHISSLIKCSFKTPTNNSATPTNNCSLQKFHINFTYNKVFFYEPYQ